MTSIRTLNNRLTKLEAFVNETDLPFYRSLDPLDRLKLLRCIDDAELGQLKDVHPDNPSINVKLKKIRSIEFDQLVKSLFEKYESQINQLVISSKEWNDHQEFTKFVRTQPSYELDKFITNKMPNTIDTFLAKQN